MAGSYPDVPSRRHAWDRDGTVAALRDITIGSSVVELSSGQRETLNSEDNASAITVVGAGSVFGGASDGADSYWAGFIFPELREFDGVFAKAGVITDSADYLGPIQTSPDTTNLIDGTWTNQTANYPDSPDVDPSYREDILSAAVSSIRGVRVNQVGAAGRLLHAVHLYGEISPGETPDRALFIDETTGLEFTAAVDFGNVPRGSSEEFEWRIKNNSASLTLNNLQYTTEDLYGGSAGWYTHTLPGGSTFQSVRQIASLAPATTTGVIRTLRVTPAGTTLGLHAGRLYINLGSLS